MFYLFVSNIIVFLQHHHKQIDLAHYLKVAPDTYYRDNKMKTKLLCFCIIMCISHVSCDNLGGLKDSDNSNNISLTYYDEGFYAGYCVAWDEDASLDDLTFIKNLDLIEIFYTKTNVRTLSFNNGAIFTKSEFHTDLSPISKANIVSYNGCGLFKRFRNADHYSKIRYISEESDLEQFKEYQRGFLDGFNKMSQLRNSGKYNPSLNMTEEIKNNEYYKEGWNEAYNGINDIHEGFELTEGVPVEEVAWKNFSFYNAGYKAGQKERYKR